MPNRLIECIRLRLVHTIVGWSNIGIFNSFNVLFLLCFSRTCGVCLNLKCIYIFIVITFKLIWFAVCVLGGGGGIKKYLTNLFCFLNFVLKFQFFLLYTNFTILHYHVLGPMPVGSTNPEWDSSREMFSPIRRHNS